MINIYHTKILGINHINSRIVNFVEAKNKSDIIILPISIEEYLQNKHYYTSNPNIICILRNFTRHRENRNLRSNYAVDNKADLPFNQFQNFIFTTGDFQEKRYIIPYFPGPIQEHYINKPKHYWLNDKIPLNDKMNNKVFWCGSVQNHNSRKEFFNYYKKMNDSRFDIQKFSEDVYSNPISNHIYDSYIKKLSMSDIAYILRGDRTWTYSFHDVIRAGCIPVMISSMNDFGWENILNNVDDYFLRFDIRTQTMDYIHEKVCELLNDKDRILQMKANIRFLYKTFFHHKSSLFSGQLIIGKCLQLFRNNFEIENIDSCILCKELLELKDIQQKI